VIEGQEAPEFTLTATGGKEVQLKDLRGKKVVLYFYPKDDTPGCTKEACAFKKAHGRIQRVGAVLLGVSPDTVDSHRRFKTRYGLNFLLLSDPEKVVAKKYGAWGEKLMYGKKVTGMIRPTFLLDSQGTVRKVFPRVRVDGHAEKVVEALESL